nr:hypothetical protein [Tanacetum cinerariifolium]
MLDNYNALIKNGTWILVPKPAGLFLSQKKYACELLERANMANCNPLRTPVDTDSKLGPEGVAVQDPTLYRSFAGGLQYLTFTRPDLSYAVQQICLYMHDPQEPHFAALKRILRYVRGDSYLSWSSKRQHTISRSNAEAEYRGVANVVAETAWLRNILRELHSPLSITTLVYCDNVSAVYLSANPVQRQRTKHIEIDIHFVCDMVQTGHIRVLHVPSRYQYADIFPKGLPTALFEDFRSRLSILVPKPAGVNMVHSMWLFKHKFHANGTLSRYKDRLVANGSSQQQGIDVDETFSPVVKPATIRTVLSLAVSRKWPIYQLDVKNAFLNALLQQIITSLHQEFDMTDLGALNYFLGSFATRSSTGLFLSQKKYACELLERANMV